MENDNSQQNLLEILRVELWNKTFGNKEIDKGNHYYKQISQAIFNQIGTNLSKDTIRNFLEKKHTPQASTLDIYSRYVLGGDSKSFRDFQLWHRKRKNRKLGMLLIGILFFLVFISVLVFSFKKNNSTNSFFTKFTTSNLDTLAMDGWTLFEEDSIRMDLWGNPKYQNSGYLTLETHLTDSYLDNKKYEPACINMLAHEIECGACCEISIKLVDFNPNQRYQQAGFYVLFNETPIPSVRMSFACKHSDLNGMGENGVSAIRRNGKYTNSPLLPISKRSIVSKLHCMEPETKIDSIVLHLEIENNEYAFSHKINNQEYISIKTIKMSYSQPTYVGLFAFQGRPDIPVPIYDTATVIPAHFDYFRIEPCNNN